jgi:hypothetical protein
MSKELAGIGAGIGAFIGLMIGLSSPTGLELIPAMNAAPDIESKVNIAIVIFILATIGAIIGGLGEQIADTVSGMFK